jgi:putative tryptophan/tyrosine transport system substrate-binding protein
MKRREFITLLGGAAAAWPLAARAQQTIPVVGFLRSASLSDATHLVAGFRQGLNDVGFVEGRNVAVEYRSAEGHSDRLPALIADLLGRQVALIVGNTIAARELRTATTTVPIVFASGGDPVKDGLVTSLNRPGGNITGVVFFSETTGTKRLELLRQLVPGVTTIAVLVNPTTPGTEEERADIVTAAKAMGQQLIVVEIASGAELETVFTTFPQRGVGALLIGSGPFRIVALAARHRLPTLYPLREFVSAGGLMSYGTSITEAYRQAGVYAGRILKGEKPGELPVMRSTKFEFVVNLKTAKACPRQAARACRRGA